MKKNIILLVLLLVEVNFYGQKKKNNFNQRVTAARISFITDNVSLTSDQAEKFWPLYNKYRSEIHKLYRKRNTLQKGINFETLQETEADLIIKKIAHIEAEIQQKKQNSDNMISKIISSKQFLKLKASELRFKKSLLEKIKKGN